MFSLYHPYIYFSLIGLCLLFSLLNRKSDDSKIYLYFLAVVIVESVTKSFDIKTNIAYTIGTFIYIIYFSFYYSKKLPDRKKMISALGLFFCAVGLYLIIASHEVFPVGLGICIALFYIMLSIIWFYDETKNPDLVFIAEKQAFWVSGALLLWSIVFLFRVMPMYWLEQNDIEFLMILHTIFKVTVLMMYALFLVAITRKH